MKKKAPQRKQAGAVRKLTKTGIYTYYVTIPREDIVALGWRERQKVVVRRSGSKLIIEKPKK